MHPTLTTAVKAARRAGNVINRGARDLDLLTVSTKGPKDFVSEVDRGGASDRETLLAAYPDHAILAEARRGAPMQAPRTSGSSIRSTARPISCTAFRSTACRRLARRGQVTQAVIFDPCRNDPSRQRAGAARSSTITGSACRGAPICAILTARLSVPRRQLPRHLSQDDEDDDREHRGAAPARCCRARPCLRRRRLLRRLLGWGSMHGCRCGQPAGAGGRRADQDLGEWDICTAG